MVTGLDWEMGTTQMEGQACRFSLRDSRPQATPWAPTRFANRATLGDPAQRWANQSAGRLTSKGTIVTWGRRFALQAATRSACTRRYARSEEHTSELQSLMRISYAVFCLKKKK